MADLSRRRLGEFVVQEEIGPGGHGVYRCEQLPLKRTAVVKVLHARGRNDAVQRFLREAQLASRLDHPYAAHVYSFGAEEDGLLWIAMEMVHGITLARRLRERGPMPLEQFVPFFECVAQVVNAAHKCRIIHRDLKPSNIMVIENEGCLLPKLLDFGIAKLSEDRAGAEGDEDPAGGESDDVVTVKIRATPQLVQRTRTDSASSPAARLTRPGAVLGSLPYMSPEQWTDAGAVGPAADVYSLGVVAYEVLTGRLPYRAGDADDYFQQHRHAEVPPLGNGFSDDLNRIICRALAKDPKQRQSNVLELASEFRRALAAQPGQQVSSLARVWNDRARSPTLLLHGGDLLHSPVVGNLECAFVAASQRRARRLAWLRRALVVLAAVSAIGGPLYWSAMQTRLAEQQTRSAQQLAEVRITEGELEQGRAALLHGEPGAQIHLAEAYKREPSPSTAFMLARSMQPRLVEQARFGSTYGRMWWAAFSPDGSQVATADDRAAQIWDGKTYKLLFTLPHGAEVYQVAYTPDGTRLVTVTETAVRIWDARSGTLICALSAKPGDSKSADYFAVAISPDGRLVAAADAAGSRVHVWNATDGTLVAELHEGPTSLAFPRLAFSADGWLATSGGGEARVFDERTWKRVLAVPGPVRSLAVDANGRLLIGAATGEVALWSVRRASRLRQLRQFGESVNAVAFSPDGTLVAAGSVDGATQVWRTDSGTLQSQLNPRHGKIVDVEFDPSAALLLAGNADGTVVVADVAEGLPLAVLDGPSNALRSAHFAPDGSRVVGASWDGTARVWNAASPYRRWSSTPTGEVCNVSSSRRFVGVACKGRSTRVWDTVNDRLLAELPSVTSPTNDDFLPVLPAVSEGGDRAAIARGDTTEIYDLLGGRLLRTIQHAAPVSVVAFASTGRDVVSGAIDGSVLVTRDDGTQRALQASSGIDAAELLPDGSVVVSDAKRRLRIYGPIGALRADLELPARVMSIQLGTARAIALPSYAGEAGPPLLIDLSRPHVVARLEGHVGWVYSARWVPGERVLTAGADGTARLWDGVSGRLLRTFVGTPRYLADATLTPDGLVIAGDADGLLRFWDAETGDKLWTLPAHKSAVTGIHLEGADIVTHGLTGEVSRWRLPGAEATIDACSRHTPCAIVLQ